MKRTQSHDVGNRQDVPAKRARIESQSGEPTMPSRSEEVTENAGFGKMKTLSPAQMKKARQREYEAQLLRLIEIVDVDIRSLWDQEAILNQVGGDQVQTLISQLKDADNGRLKLDEIKPLWMTNGQIDTLGLADFTNKVIEKIKLKKSLYNAACTGNLEELMNYVEGGGSVESIWFGRTLTYVAARDGQVACVKYLVSKGDNVNRTARNGYTPAHLAAANGHRKVLKVLCDLGADLTLSNRGDTCFSLAQKTGHDDIIQFLEIKSNQIEFGPNTDYSFSQIKKEDIRDIPTDLDFIPLSKSSESIDHYASENVILSSHYKWTENFYPLPIELTYDLHVTKHTEGIFLLFSRNCREWGQHGDAVSLTLAGAAVPEARFTFRTGVFRGFYIKETENKKRVLAPGVHKIHARISHTDIEYSADGEIYAKGIIDPCKKILPSNYLRVGFGIYHHGRTGYQISNLEIHRSTFGNCTNFEIVPMSPHSEFYYEKLKCILEDVFDDIHIATLIIHIVYHINADIQMKKTWG